jgi:hypothetical protein
MIQSNDGGANVSTDGGRTWSTQMNQPTAEMYGVFLDNAFPYKLYGAQQDQGGTVIIPSQPAPARREGRPDSAASLRGENVEVQEVRGAGWKLEREGRHGHVGTEIVGYPGVADRAFSPPGHQTSTAPGRQRAEAP